MESFNLNIIPGKTRPVCHASQFDTGRVIRVNLFEDANIYTLSGSEEVSLSVRKPDGNVVTASIENTGDSFVEIVTTEQMTAVAGSNLCELKIEDDGKVIGTMNFILETEQDPLEGGIESQSEIDNLETQVNEMVVEAVAEQYDSNAVIFDQEPTAGHGNGYTVTSAGIKAAIDAVSSAVAAINTLVGNLDTEVEGLSTSLGDLTSEVSALDVTVQAKQNANDAALTTTSKNVVGAINEVNAKNLEFWTLMYQEQANSSTHRLVTLQSGRKFSDYNYIVFGCMSGGLVRNSIVRPVVRFSTNQETLEVDFSTSTETRWACLHFVSDTTAEVWAYASGVTIDLYGMRLT